MPKNPLENLDIVLSQSMPFLANKEVEEIRTKLLNYVASGLSDGYQIALIKTNEVTDEIQIKVLNFFDKK